MTGKPIKKQEIPNKSQSIGINSYKKINNTKLIIVIPLVLLIIISIIFIPKLIRKKDKKNMSEMITNSSSFFINNKEGLYAMFNVDGKQLTKFIYKNNGEFINGATYVQNADDQYGIISDKGKMTLDFGKYRYITQYAGVFEVTDENYNSFLIDKSGKIIYELKDYSLNSYDMYSFLILKQNETYYVLSYDGKEITNFPVDSSDKKPVVNEYGDYISIFYNNKNYIINPYTKKIINTFDSNRAFCVQDITKNGLILLKTCYSRETKYEKKIYKLIENNNIKDFPDECEEIYFDLSDNNIICKSENNKYLLDDSLKKDFKLSSEKAYIDIKKYAIERYNRYNLPVRVDFIKDGNTIEKVAFRELVYSGNMPERLYLLKVNRLPSGNIISNGYYEYYNENGEIMFGRSFAYAEGFDCNNLAMVKEINNKDYSLIDLKGKQVSGIYEKIEQDDHTNYYIVENNKMSGIIDDKGNEIVPCKYETIIITNDKYAKLITQSEEIVIFNFAKNKEIITLDFEDVKSSYAGEDYLLYEIGDKKRYYSYTTGKMFYEE